MSDFQLIGLNKDAPSVNAPSEDDRGIVVGQFGTEGVTTVQYLTGASKSLSSNVPTNTAVGDLFQVSAYSSSAAKYPATWKCTSIAAALPSGAVAGDVTGNALGVLYVQKDGADYYKFELVGDRYVEAFGARAGSDDHAAIQATIDSLPSTGGKVLFQAEEYEILSTIALVDDNVVLEGAAGKDGTRITADGITAISLTSVEQVKIKNLRLYSNRTPSTYGIYISSSPRGIVIDNVYCDAFGVDKDGGGFRLVNLSWGVSFLNCEVERCGYGLYNTGCHMMSLYQCIMRQLTGTAVIIENASTFNILGGVYEKVNGTYNALAGNGYAIIVNNCHTGFIQCYTEQCRDGLIKIVDSEAINVVGTFLNGFSDASLDFGMLYLSGSKCCQIMGCNVDGLSSLVTGKACIYLDATCEFNHMQGNWLEPDGSLGAGNKLIIDLGSNNSYMNNEGQWPSGNDYYGFRMPAQDLVAGSLTADTGGMSCAGNITTSSGDATVTKNAIGNGPTLTLLNNQNESATGQGATLKFQAQNNGRQFSIRSSSTGTFGRSPALIFESNNDSGGIVERMRIRASGIVRPGVDNTQSLGESSYRWSEVYSANLRLGSGATTWTSGSGTPEGAVTAVVGSMFTRTDGGASTTLYVKESGSGNTGWVAK